MLTDACLGRRGIASRAGPIHVFDEDSPVSPDAFAASSAEWADVPVVVRSDRGATRVGSGRLVGGHVDGDDLIGTIVWPADIEEMAGDADSTARCEWDADGRLVRVVVDLDEGPDGQDIDDEPDDDDPDADESSDHDHTHNPDSPESCECEACRSGGTCGDDPESDESDESPTPKKPPAGTSEESPMPAAAPAKADDSQLDPEVKNSVVLKRLIDKYGSLDKAATKLVAMNIRQGEQIKELDGRIAAAPQIPEGSAVLPKSDADLLAIYRELGDPKALKESIAAANSAKATAETDAASARKELGDLSRAATLKDVAAKAGYAPDVFLDRVARLPADAAFEPTTVKVRGADVETFAVKYKDQDGKDVSKTLDELEAGDWAAYVPALKPGSRVAQQGDRERVPSATGFRGEDRPARQASNIDRDPMSVARDALQSRLHVGV